MRGPTGLSVCLQAHEVRARLIQTDGTREARREKKCVGKRKRERKDSAAVSVLSTSPEPNGFIDGRRDQLILQERKEQTRDGSAVTKLRKEENQTNKQGSCPRPSIHGKESSSTALLLFSASSTIAITVPLGAPGASAPNLMRRERAARLMVGRQAREKLNQGVYRQPTEGDNHCTRRRQSTRRQ